MTRTITLIICITVLLLAWRMWQYSYVSPSTGGILRIDRLTGQVYRLTNGPSGNYCWAPMDR